MTTLTLRAWAAVNRRIGWPGIVHYDPVVVEWWMWGKGGQA